MRGRWRELLSILADLAAVVSAGIVLVAGRGYAVGTISRTWLAVVVVGGLLFLMVVGWLRRRAWWGAIRPRYVTCVAWLAKPVGEEVRVRLRGEGVLRVVEETTRRLPGLRVGALKVLQFALAALDSAGDGPCVLDTHQVFPGLGYGAISEATRRAASWFRLG